MSGARARTQTLFGAPGSAYVYRSYGIHAMLNFVCEPEGSGGRRARRALEPLTRAVELMRERRGAQRAHDLCARAGQARAGARHLAVGQR